MTGMIWFNLLAPLWLVCTHLFFFAPPCVPLIRCLFLFSPCFSFIDQPSSSLHPAHTAPPARCDRPLTDPVLLSSFSLFLPSLQVLASLPPCPSPAPRSNPVPLPQSYEPDELTEEMAHLEGLMKDLNAITTAPWAQGHAVSAVATQTGRHTTFYCQTNRPELEPSAAVGRTDAKRPSGAQKETPLFAPPQSREKTKKSNFQTETSLWLTLVWGRRRREKEEKRDASWSEKRWTFRSRLTGRLWFFFVCLLVCFPQQNFTWFTFELSNKTAGLGSAGFVAGAAQSCDAVFVRSVFPLCIL